MGKIVQVGIIGLGRSGSGIHGEYLAGVPRKFRIAAVADPLPDRRAKAAEAYGCDTFAHWRALLRRDDIDVIINASPTRQHVPWSVACLEAGFHVVSEKPLARKVAEVGKVIRAARKAKRIMTVFQNYRFHPSFLQVQKVMQSGVLGRIVLIKSSTCKFKRRWDWQTTRRNYGGDLLNTGSHPLDQVLLLMGGDNVPEVSCLMDRAVTYGDAEDHVKILLSARGCPPVDFEVSSCCAYPSGDMFNVFGTRGGLRATWNTVEWKYFDPRKQPKHELIVTPFSDANGAPAYCSDKLKWKEASKTFSDAEVFTASIKRFYDLLYATLTQGKKPAVTLEQIRRQVAVIEECHRQNPAGSMHKADV